MLFFFHFEDREEFYLVTSLENDESKTKHFKNSRGKEKINQRTSVSRKMG